MEENNEVEDIDIKLTGKYVYANLDDKDKLIDCGKLIQSFKLRYYGYGNGNQIIFQVI